MKKKIIITLAVLVIVVAGAMWFMQSKNKDVHSENFSSYTAKQTQDAMSRNVPVIDIRRLDEWRRSGIISDSHKLTFFDGRGHSDAPKWLEEFKQIVTDKNQEFILVCAHANRTKVVGKFLNTRGYTAVRELEGGINYGWIDKGLKTVPYR